VLGAGMMGAAIAYVCARAGLDVVLRDVTPEAAARGKAYSEKLVGKDLSRQRPADSHETRNGGGGRASPAPSPVFAVLPEGKKITRGGRPIFR